jgi:8-oxo-dGTP pyrophosphatase MutT (NUDIX family)
MSEEANAATVLLFDDRGYVLALDWKAGYQLPGGKREPGDETIFETAKRELREETGVVLAEASEVYRARAGDHLCACFLARAWTRSTEPPRDGSVGPEGRPLTWVEPIVLVAPFSRFPSFYSHAFTSLVQRERLVAEAKALGKKLRANRARAKGACPVCEKPVDDAGDPLCGCGAVL